MNDVQEGRWLFAESDGHHTWRSGPFLVRRWVQVYGDHAEGQGRAWLGNYATLTDAVSAGPSARSASGEAGEEAVASPDR